MIKSFNKLFSRISISQNIKKDILTFIIYNREKLEILDIKTLLILREKYSTSLESILFLIALAEISKVIKSKNIRVFLLYITRNKDISVDKFIKQEIPFFDDEKFLEKSFHQSLPIVYQYIQKTFHIIFETRYKLAKFTEKIGLADIISNSFREDLSIEQKQKLKGSMFNMTKDFYISIFPIYDYLVKTQINTIDAINYQTIEDNQRLIDGIEFYILYDKKKAFLYLEKLKSKIFIENLYLKNSNEFQELNNLKEKVFNLQQQAYLQENIFNYIQELYENKMKLQSMQVKYNIDEEDSLSFENVKGLL
jgi:hypothetical protein